MCSGKTKTKIFDMQMTSIVLITFMMINLFSMIKIITNTWTGMDTAFPIDLKDSSYIRIFFTEIAYSVIFVLIDGAIEKAIKINKGEESMENIITDFKLNLEEDRQRRIGKFKSYLPSDSQIQKEDGTRRRHKTFG